METPGLSRSERAVLELVQRVGVAGFVGVVTSLAMASSLAIVAVSLLVTGTFAYPEIWVQALATTAAVPAVVAPPMTFLMARIVTRLSVTTDALLQASTTDGLTGALNRRGFFQAVADVECVGHGIEIGMLDLDHFKQLNDNYGHAFGDRALRAVAHWIARQIGPAGIVGRLGGDEFAYAVPVDGAFGGLPPRQTFRLEGVVFQVSIGRSRCGAAGGVDGALAAADASLYELKHRRAGSQPVEAPTEVAAAHMAAPAAQADEPRSVFALAN